jgi:hypothetical protein
MKWYAAHDMMLMKWDDDDYAHVMQEIECNHNTRALQCSADRTRESYT